MQFSIWALLLFAAISFATAALAMLLQRVLVPGDTAPPRSRRLPVYSDVARRYVFREGYLLSDIDPNDAFLDEDLDRSRALDALRLTLSALHPDVPDRLAALDARDEAFLLTVSFAGDDLLLSGRKEEDCSVLTISPAHTIPGREAVDSDVLRAMTDEVEDMRQVIDASPLLIWKQGSDGQIDWANAAYFDAVREVQQLEQGSIWPIPNIFDLSTDQLVPGDPPVAAQLTLPGAVEVAHFDITASRRSGCGLIVCAMPTGRVVAAETALSGFVQTMSKTFASLPIGLAVFDASRELVLFNPALTAISALDIEVLSNRPTLVEFLDALRDRNRTPEPKDYRTWRDKIARLERGAADGDFHDIWTLPSGESLRVFGHPQSDGSLALMFQDITAEVALTRRFRGDLEICQSVIDAFPSGLAVFAHDGTTVLRNASYASFWGDGDNGLRDAIGRWRQASEPTRLWDAILNTAARDPHGTRACGEVVLLDGRQVTCSAVQIAGGATLVQFDGLADLTSDMVEPVSAKFFSARARGRTAVGDGTRNRPEGLRAPSFAKDGTGPA